ncbi:MAG: transcriptional regulator [Acidimicrobiia bacterium]
MSDTAGVTLLERARDAASRGEWPAAYALLDEADGTGSLRPADLPFLADVAYAAGELDVTIAAWERAYAAAFEGGDQMAAAGAAMRVALHLLLDTALMAPVRGWLKRTEQHLEGAPDTPVHAWLGMAHTYERLLAGDFEAARTWARVAIDVGDEHEPAAAAIGRVAQARIVILDGEVDDGLALLEAAGMSIVTSQLDPISTGIVYCELVCALQGLAQYDLAEEWTDAFERWRRTNALGSVHGRCRVHRAEILRLRGSCRAAEQEALRACDELRPYLRRELGWPLTELGRIRLRLGDLGGAEAAFLEAHHAGWDPHPGLALVQLARGDVDVAVASIRDALEHPMTVPSKELPPHHDLRRAPLLDAQVEIELAAGNVARARAAAAELEHVATRFGSKALVANAALASGRVSLAAGDPVEAARQLETAVLGWQDVGAPFETASARAELARAHRALGNENRAVMEESAARALFERIAAVEHASAPPEAAAAPSDAVGNVFRREGDYWTVVFDGQTTRVRDLKGVRYLARLLDTPGRELHVLDLVAGEHGGVVSGDRAAEPSLAFAASDDAGVMLDDRAKEAYRRRLVDIDDDIDDARSMGDSERAAQAEFERELLIAELSRAVGLGGRDRRAGAASERARASVTRALRQAMSRIRADHPRLGEHLDRAVQTGTYCAYLPDPSAPVTWAL